MGLQHDSIAFDGLNYKLRLFVDNFYDVSDYSFGAGHKRGLVCKTFL